MGFTKVCRRCHSVEHVRRSVCTNCGLVFFAKKSSKKFRMREIRARRKCESPDSSSVSQHRPSRPAKNFHELCDTDMHMNGESSATEQQPDEDIMDTTEPENVVKEKCIDSEQVLVEEEQTDTVAKEEDQHGEIESVSISEPVTDDITSTSTVKAAPKRRSTTITFTRSPAKDSAEYREHVKKLEDLRLPPLLRSSYLTPVSSSVWSVKDGQSSNAATTSAGNGEESASTVVRKGPKVKVVKRSQKPKRLSDRPAAANKKKDTEVADNCLEQRKGRGRPKGSGWLQQEREDEVEQVLEDRGEFFSLVLVGINSRLSQQNTLWNKLKEQSL